MKDDYDNISFEIYKKTKFLNGIQKLGEEMVWLELNKRKGEQNSLLFAYEDFCKKNDIKIPLPKRRNTAILELKHTSDKTLTHSKYKSKASNKSLNISINNQFSFKSKNIKGSKSKKENQSTKSIINVKNKSRKSAIINVNDKSIKKLDIDKKTINYLKFVNKRCSFDNNILKPNLHKNSDKTIKNSSNNDKSSKRNELDSGDSLENFEIEIVKPEEFNKSITTDNNLISQNNNKKNSTDKMYYKEMKLLNNKINKINKKRDTIIEEKLSQVQSLPKINQNTDDIIQNKKKIYTPIYLRDDQINGRLKIKYELIEKKRRMDKENEEKKLMMEIKSKNPPKQYDEENWKNFVEKQFKWKEEINIKKKESEMLKYEIIRKQRNKNKMSSGSRNIMQKMIKKYIAMDDDVFFRLYDDYKKRGERIESLNKYYMPSFRPKIKKYKKFINKEIIKQNNTDIFITNFDKDNYFLDSQLSIDRNYKNYFLPINKKANRSSLCASPIVTHSHVGRHNQKNRSKNNCCYCANESITIRNKNKRNNKYSSIDINSALPFKSTIDNTFQNMSKNKAIDFMSISESCSQNKNNISNTHDQSLIYEKIHKRNNKKMEINKLNYSEKKNKINNGITNQLQLFKQHIIKNNLNRKGNGKKYINSFDNNNNNIHYNKTFEVYNKANNKYSDFFNFDNIDEL